MAMITIGRARVREGTSGRGAEHRRPDVTGVLVVLLLLALAGLAMASPPPPAPGGPHALGFGGDNLGGYPPLLPTTDVPERGGPALAFAVRVSPNPAHAGARFAFHGAAGATRVAVYSIAGRRVREWQLAAGEGSPTLDWDLRDGRGRTVPPGLYFWRAEAGSAVLSGKVAVIP